eukprot:PhF_6_TR34663/c0_g1_i1/m.50431
MIGKTQANIASFKSFLRNSVEVHHHHQKSSPVPSNTLRITKYGSKYFRAASLDRITKETDDTYDDATSEIEEKEGEREGVNTESKQQQQQLAPSSPKPQQLLRSPKSKQARQKSAALQECLVPIPTGESLVILPFLLRYEKARELIVGHVDEYHLYFLTSLLLEPSVTNISGVVPAFVFDGIVENNFGMMNSRVTGDHKQRLKKMYVTLCGNAGGLHRKVVLALLQSMSEPYSSAYFFRVIHLHASLSAGGTVLYPSEAKAITRMWKSVLVQHQKSVSGGDWELLKVFESEIEMKLPHTGRIWSEVVALLDSDSEFLKQHIFDST